MRQLLLNHWQYWVSTLLLLVAGGWTLFTYFDQKKDELAWRRTEFLFEQARYVESDPEINAAIRLLEGRDTISIDRVLADSASSDPNRALILHSLDKLLNVFDRLAYAVYTSKTLTAKELEIFAWYLDKVADIPELRDYCRQNGYGDVIRLSEDVSPSPTPRVEKPSPD